MPPAFRDGWPTIGGLLHAERGLVLRSRLNEMEPFKQDRIPYVELKRDAQNAACCGERLMVEGMTTTEKGRRRDEEDGTTADRSAARSHPGAPPDPADGRRRLPALPNGRGDHRRHPRGPEDPDAHVSRVGPDVPRSHRRVRQEGAGPERDRRRQRQRAYGRRRA